MKSNFIPYYYYEGQILNPSKIIVEKELEKAVNAELDNCKNIEGKDFKLEFRNPRTKVFIKEKELLFDIYFPVTIDIDGKSTALFRDYQINRISGSKEILPSIIVEIPSRKSFEIPVTSSQQASLQKYIGLRMTLNDQARGFFGGPTGEFYPDTSPLDKMFRNKK